MPRVSASSRASTSRSWDAVAEWYLGWSGTRGSIHHRRTAIPLLLDLLAPRPGERILDLGCGPAALAPHIAQRRGTFVGIDRSRRLIDAARRAHRGKGRFLVGDVTALDRVTALDSAPFDAVTFLLSIQDIDPLAAAFAGLRARLTATGRVVIVMIHPCFRVPRQSGWGWDAHRQLQFRRVDSYLTPLSVPMRSAADGRAATRSYHRPLEHYVGVLAEAGFVIDALREVPAQPVAQGSPSLAQRRAEAEFPLFLGLRARRAAP